ncbi:sigma-B regulation protein RsbU (phosphoserine phosphatase) [Gracilibacillus ureilyticus]|uniref:Sigma-B regulation protein RsbU (Phosphoserine phosphatase) n=1 Tax=Gracilibacillus ureilyticus TaxID=531814 RepID=A0A1H9M4A9_9BACI|nr:PP2C family protein-serine/threonine phosphatase [Gracilibacillus ureilyticus]SER18538.1 sigma-B regulation protein RsbU (phosphoserine phosphatase) [Gracilibacillus ureilyticus]
MFHHEKGHTNENTELDKTLVREIKLARNIQMKLLNGDKPQLKNGTVSGISIPARRIGGDYFDFYQLPDGKLRIIIGDVMGKGIPAAMLMILTRGAFRSAAEKASGPAEILTIMNHAIYDDLRSLGSFVTVLCADWDPERKELSYASAGHCLPLVIRSEECFLNIPHAGGVMLGGIPDVVYKQSAVYLDGEDVLFFYTDGITEAQNQSGDMYRLTRLQQVLLENAHLDVKTLEEAVEQSVIEFTRGLPQKDDITMVTMKVNRVNAQADCCDSPLT